MDISVELKLKDEFDQTSRSISESINLDNEVHDKHLPNIIRHIIQALQGLGFIESQINEYIIYHED
jgi:hypothetical protein